MKPLNAKKMQEFLKLAGSRLKGDWVLLGGTVLPVLGIDYRVTVDIDLANRDQDTSQTLELMNIAEDMGLPVETINQAGSFFLYRIPDFENKLELLHKGKSATIYRPNLELYFQLKIERLSESDTQDCLEYLRWYKNSKATLDEIYLRKLLERQKKKKISTAQSARIDTLISALRYPVKN